MDHDLSPESEIGEYRITHTLGIGGFGVTYLAEDTKLGVQVAIKEYFPAAYAIRTPDQQVQARPDPMATKLFQWGLNQFLKEARLLAQFKHINIVRVLRFLEERGTAYMVMEYEYGKTLSDYLEDKGGRLDERELLRIFLPILNGLHEVHKAGLLHLDIKPDNIYLCGNERPMLIDFGSANQAAQQVDDGHVALTPAYAAIEQYPNKGKRGPWTDVFAMGASMYRCISGEAPVDAMKRYKCILKQQPDPLTPATGLKLNGFTDTLLDCIDWALDVYPQKRPKNAQVLQQALMGKGRPGASPVKQKAPAPAPAPAPAAPTKREEQYDESGNRLELDPWRVTRWVLGLLLVIGIGGTTAMWLTRQKPTQVTDPELLAMEVPLPGTPDIQEPSEVVSEPATAPDPVVSMPAPERLSKRLAGHDDWVYSIVTIPKSQLTASADGAGDIIFWDTGARKFVKRIKAHNKAIHALAVSSDGKLLASAGTDAKVKLWDARTGAAVGTLAGHDHTVYALAFSPHNRWLASAGKGRSIILWDMATRQQKLELLGHEASILALAFSPDGATLASAGENIRLWSLETANETDKLYAHRGKVFALRYSPDGRWLASAGGGGFIKIWNRKQEDAGFNFSGTSQTVHALAFSPDSRWLVSAGTRKDIQVWSMETGSHHGQLDGHNGPIQALSFTNDGNLISGGRDKDVILWEAKPENP